MGFPSVCVKFKTFVCSKCKSSHQSFSHRVKHYSMSSFTLQEVEGFKDENGGGNAYARRTYFAKLREESSAWPCDGDTLDIYKDFIKKAYIDKHWMKSGGSKKDKKKRKKGKKHKKSRQSDFGVGNDGLSDADDNFFNEIAAANNTDDIFGDGFSTGNNGNLVPPNSVSGGEEDFFSGVGSGSNTHGSDNKSNEGDDMWGIGADNGTEANTSFDVFANAASGQSTSSAAQDDIFGDFASSTSAENSQSNSSLNSDLFSVSSPAERNGKTNGKKSKSSKKKKRKSKSKEIDAGEDLLNFSDNDQGGVDGAFVGNSFSKTNTNGGSSSALDFFSSEDISNSSNNGLFGTLPGATQSNASASMNRNSNMVNNNNGMIGMNNGNTYDPFAMLTNAGSVKKTQQMPSAPYMRQRPQMMPRSNVMSNRMNNLNLTFNHSTTNQSGMTNTSMNSMSRTSMNSGSGMSSMMPMMPMNKSQFTNRSNVTTKRSTNANDKKHDPFAGLSGI